MALWSGSGFFSESASDACFGAFSNCCGCGMQRCVGRCVIVGWQPGHWSLSRGKWTMVLEISVCSLMIGDGPSGASQGRFGLILSAKLRFCLVMAKFSEIFFRLRTLIFLFLFCLTDYAYNFDKTRKNMSKSPRCSD